MVDLDNVNLELKDLIGSNWNEEVGLAHLLSLPILLTKRRQGNNYSNSHVITSNQYLAILKQKAMDKKNYK